MKDCSWFLWLCGKKVYNIRQLRENFDTAALIGYYLGGSLMKWLADAGETQVLKRLHEIDRFSGIGKQLEFAFGVSPDISAEETAETDAAPPVLPGVRLNVYGDIASSFPSAVSSMGSIGIMNGADIISSMNVSSIGGTGLSGVYSILSSFGSSFNYGSAGLFLNGGSYSGIYSSGIYSSLILGAYPWNTGSSYSAGNSFILSSGIYGTYERFLRRWFSYGGSGFYGSGSYNMLYYFRRFYKSGSFSGSGGSFSLLPGSYGSYSMNGAFLPITEREYRRTLINLSSCPLNAYGYGINLI